MRIERLNYSRAPWRLLDSQGREIQITRPMKHPDIGMTVVSGSVCGNTKQECLNNALALLEILLRTRSTTPCT